MRRAVQTKLGFRIKNARALNAAINELSIKAKKLNTKSHKYKFLVAVYKFLCLWEGAEDLDDNTIREIAIERRASSLHRNANLAHALIRTVRSDEDGGKVASRWARACNRALTKGLDPREFELRLYQHGVDGFLG
jgi:hypothetical protein